MSKQLTWDELKDKYGDVEVMFSSYYKHTFCYRGHKDGLEIFCSYCGDGDIYRHEVSADFPEKVKDLEPDSVQIYRGDEVIENYN